VRKADNLPPSCAVVTKFGNLNFLEPSVPVQTCNGTALSLLEGAELSGTRPGHFTSRERPRDKMNRRLAGGQSRSEPFKKDRSLLKRSGIEAQIIGSAASA